MGRLAEILAGEVESGGPEVRDRLVGGLLERALGPGAGDIAQMLQGLLEGLSAQARREVLAELLDLALHGRQESGQQREPAWPDPLGRLPAPGPLTPREALLGEVAAGSRWQTVPLRLTVEQHEGLKQWCQANDFSMAVVLRGLVGRFLEDQERAGRR